MSIEWGERSELVIRTESEGLTLYDRPAGSLRYSWPVVSVAPRDLEDERREARICRKILTFETDTL